MRIGIDGRVIGTGRALDVYTRNLIEELTDVGKKHRFIILVNSSKQKDGLRDSKNLEFHFIPRNPTLVDHYQFLNLIRPLKLDVIWHPDNREFLRCINNSVVTIHDLTPYKYPELILSRSKLKIVKQNLYFVLQKKALKQAKRIISVSENTKRDLIEMFGIESEKIVVVPDGVGKDFFHKYSKEEIDKVLRKYKVKQPYIFYIGGLNAHKNVNTLVEAVAQIRDKDIDLVIGGKTVDDTASSQNIFDSLVRLINKLGLSSRVRFTGFIDEDDLPLMYQGAELFVYPSLYEGFGLPPLEAMASSLPVITSNSSSLGELVSDAGLTIDPKRSDKFASAIDEVLRDQKLHKHLSEIANKKAQLFSWKSSAKRVLDVLEEVGS